MTNVISPTGCVHQAENDQFSVKGSRRTVCNHKNYGYYHHWEDTNKPVTCKRCLKLMEPKLIAQRLDFKWVKTNNEVHATVTINSWYNSGPVFSEADKKEIFLLYAGKGIVGMRGLNGGTIPKMSAEKSKWLRLVARTYYSASFGEREDFFWSELE